MNKNNVDKKEIDISFKIAGIDCAECSAQLEKSIKTLPGVNSAKINFAASKLDLKISGSTDLDNIKKQIETWGYTAEEAITSKTAVFIIQEMDCNDEVEIVNNKLAKLPDIINFKINLMSQKLNVEYASDKISADDIIAALAQVKLTATFVKGQKRDEQKAWWQNSKIIFLALSGGITLLTFILQYLGLPAGIAAFAYALAIIIGGYHPAKAGLAALKVYSLNINTLLVVAAIGAGILGLWEEGALLVFVFSLGAVLESYAVDKARGSIRALMELAPGQALVKRDCGEIEIPVEEIRLDDLVIVKPGEKIPVDGMVAAGSSTVDQSPITGESMPITKKSGDKVYAATINQRGALEIKVTKLAKDSTLSKIIHLVEEAQTKKASYQRFGDKFGRLYTPIMFGLALCVAVIPPLFFGQPFTPWLYRSLVVLVVSCSCGIVLSIPVSVLAAISNAARNGILVKGGVYLEALGSVKVVAFDKTGTLTIGKPQVTDID
ncbi:MAG TPA: cation-transporting P-type ATPase, partial [Actinobacteria bacterium]|nr:cation-transporting P-type ATPase [Actinomycetes bacterium]HEX21635.1 cation-transporting P-type ATPase [Actinomycetota bacterium]